MDLWTDLRTPTWVLCWISVCSLWPQFLRISRWWSRIWLTSGWSPSPTSKTQCRTSLDRKPACRLPANRAQRSSTCFRTWSAWQKTARTLSKSCQTISATWTRSTWTTRAWKPTCRTRTTSTRDPKQEKSCVSCSSIRTTRQSSCKPTKWTRCRTSWSLQICSKDSLQD